MPWQTVGMGPLDQRESLRVVTTLPELMAALDSPSVEIITIAGTITGVPTIRLAKGKILNARNPNAILVFAKGSDGLQLTADNEVRDLQLKADDSQRSIFNDLTIDSLGKIVLSNLRVTGRVQLLGKDKVKTGDVEIDGLDILSADARACMERPHGFGVHVLQGAFTLWNMQEAADSVITARLKGISAGREDAPVLGSGVFVSGAGFEKSGMVHISLLETEAIYSNGMIAAGTPDLITGGVFTVYGVYARQVINEGPVVTYGVNDMVLDNWGTVHEWIARKKISSSGASGIGFVNFGFTDKLILHAPIETSGKGARGFNVYEGTVNYCEFDRIITRADGAVGVQIGQPIGTLKIRNGIETFGGTGDSLVKGVITPLSAIGLSVKPGGSAKEVIIDGGIITHGEGIAPIEILGDIQSLKITGSVRTGTKKN